MICDEIILIGRIRIILDVETDGTIKLAYRYIFLLMTLYGMK